MFYKYLLYLAVTIGSLLLATAAWAQDTTPTYRVVGYFSSWGIYDREYFVTTVPADQLTHINYAFVFISDDGECMFGDEWADAQFPYPGDNEDDDSLKGNFKQLQLLKEAHPKLQTLISVGGWTGSAKFSDVALTAEAREKFAASCVKFMKQYGFDGIDIDWEFPTGGGDAGNTERPEDVANYPLMLAELRKQLDVQDQTDGRHYLLTIAAATGQDFISKLDWTQIEPALDWINVMTYDFSGSWSEKTGFNAPLYDSVANPPEGGSVDSVIQDYLATGIPAQKLVVGVPFYGRGWSGVAATDNGLHQSYGESIVDDGMDFRTMGDYLKTYTRYWSDTAKVPWLYDPTSGTMISYDDAESLKAKVDYVKTQGLGGVMIWELASDDADHSLLDAVTAELAAP